MIDYECSFNLFVLGGSMSVVLTQQNFQNEVLDSDVPVLVDFWAPWCGPCRTMGPVIDALSAEISNVKIAKFNVDDVGAPEVLSKYEIMGLPTLMIFVNGEVVAKRAGSTSRKNILKMIENNT